MEKHEIPFLKADEFLTLLEENKGCLYLSGCKIDGIIEITEGINASHLQLEQCDLSINIYDFVNNYGLEVNFIHCQIGLFKLQECESKFSHANFEPKFWIKFYEKCTINYFNISYNKEILLNLSINDSEIINKFEYYNNYCLENEDLVSELKISNTDFKCEFIFSNNTLNEFKISDESVLQEHLNWSNNKIESLFILSSFFKSYNYFKDMQFKHCLISNCIFNGRLQLARITAQELCIYGNNFEDDIHLYNEGNNNINLFELNSNRFNSYAIIGFLETTHFDQLKLNYNNNSFGKLYVGNIIAEKIILEGENTNLHTHISTSKLDKIYFDNFKNFSDFKISEVEPNESVKSIISIKESNLSKVNFYKTDFSQFKDIEIVNSNLVETTFANVTWFKKEQINAQNTDYKNSREVFRQLKYALEKQGNKIDALYFKALEMEAYQKELKDTQNSDWKDKWIMCFNSTNDFGLNWVKPVVFLLGGTLVFYFFIILSMLPNYSCDNTCNFPTLFKNNLKQYPRLLDPTHSIDKIFEGCNYEIGFWANALSYTLKIYLAFFIFQTIKAFRKFAE